MKNYQKFLFIFLIIYTIFVAYILLFPLPDLAKVNLLFPEPMNFLPSDVLWRWFFDENFSYEIPQILRHIPLMLPFGILFPLIFPRFQKFSQIILLAIFIGFLSECLQFFIGFLMWYNYRTVDANDVILNFFGVLIWYFFFIILKNFLTKFYKSV